MLLHRLRSSAGLYPILSCHEFPSCRPCVCRWINKRPSPTWPCLSGNTRKGMLRRRRHCPATFAWCVGAKSWIPTISVSSVRLSERNCHCFMCRCGLDNGVAVLWCRSVFLVSSWRPSWAVLARVACLSLLSPCCCLFYSSFPFVASKGLR